MNKSDLIEKVVEKTNLPHKRAELVVNLIFNTMTHALAQGKRIELRGFGSLISKIYQAHLGRNPRTGQAIYVPTKRRPSFRVSKQLRGRVNKAARWSLPSSHSNRYVKR